MCHANCVLHDFLKGKFLVIFIPHYINCFKFHASYNKVKPRYHANWVSLIAGMEYGMEEWSGL